MRLFGVVARECVSRHTSLMARVPKHLQNGRFFIYALVDPCTDRLFYIGYSTTGMRRTRRHTNDRRSNPRKCAVTRRETYRARSTAFMADPRNRAAATQAAHDYVRTPEQDNKMLTGMAAFWRDDTRSAPLRLSRSVRVTGENNPAKRSDVRAKISAAATLRELRKYAVTYVL